MNLFWIHSEFIMNSHANSPKWRKANRKWFRFLFIRIHFDFIMNSSAWIRQNEWKINSFFIHTNSYGPKGHRLFQTSNFLFLNKRPIAELKYVSQMNYRISFEKNFWEINQHTLRAIWIRMNKKRIHFLFILVNSRKWIHYGIKTNSYEQKTNLFSVRSFSFWWICMRIHNEFGMNSEWIHKILL